MFSWRRKKAELVEQIGAGIEISASAMAIDVGRLEEMNRELQQASAELDRHRKESEARREEFEAVLDKLRQNLKDSLNEHAARRDKWLQDGCPTASDVPVMKPLRIRPATKTSFASLAAAVYR